MSDYAATILAESSLVYYWQFDEASGLIAADSKDANTGTMSFGAGLGGQTLNANLGAHCATLQGGNARMLSVQTFNQAHASVECWVSVSSLPGSGKQGIAGFSDGTSWDKVLFVDSSGHFGFYAYDGAAKIALSSGTYVAGAWHHIVGTADGVNLKIYVDGSLVGTTACGNTFSSYTGANTRLGIFGGDYTVSPNASIDEFAVYNAALSSGSILTHFQAGSTVNYCWPQKPLQGALEYLDPRIRLASHFYDRGAPRNEVNGQRATVSGALGYVNGAFGLARDCPTINSSLNDTYFNIQQVTDNAGGDTSLRPCFFFSNSSIECWMSFRTIASSSSMWAFADHDSYQAICRLTNTNKVLVSAASGGSGTVTGSVGLVANRLYQIGVTNSRGTTYLYINGTLDNSGAISPVVDKVNQISAFRDDTLGHSPDGTMHLLRVYARALTASEWRALYADPWSICTSDQDEEQMIQNVGGLMLGVPVGFPRALQLDPHPMNPLSGVH